MTGRDERGYPHYWSTYCIHLRHVECRLVCKICEAPCLCICHVAQGFVEAHPVLGGLIVTPGREES